MFCIFVVCSNVSADTQYFSVVVIFSVRYTCLYVYGMYPAETLHFWGTADLAFRGSVLLMQQFTNKNKIHIRCSYMLFVKEFPAVCAFVCVCVSMHSCVCVCACICVYLRLHAFLLRGNSGTTSCWTS